jgi:hypothetical protein
MHGFEGQPVSRRATELMAPLIRSGYSNGPDLPVLTTRLAVHNPGSMDVDVDVSYRGFLGTCVGREVAQGPITVAPGSTRIVEPAGEAGGPLPAGCSASAVIRATHGLNVATALEEGVARMHRVCLPGLDG